MNSSTSDSSLSADGQPARPRVAPGGPRFSHVAVSVTNLERSLSFYRDGLSFAAGEIYEAAGSRLAALMNIPPAGFRGVFLRAGQCYVELLEYRVPAGDSIAPRRPVDTGYAHTSVLLADVEQVLPTIVKHGGTVLGRLRHSFGGAGDSDIAFVADPDHNRIELIAHPDAAEAIAHGRFLGSDHLGWPQA